MSVRILTDFGTKAKKRPRDAPLVMHVRVWLIGLNLTNSIKWRNIFIAQSQIAKHTHRKVDGSKRTMSFNLRQDYSYATTNTDINVSRLSRLFSLMNTFNQFCFRKRTISCGYPYTKTLILTFSRHFRFFFFCR